MKIKNMMMVVALAMTTACMTPLAFAQGDILDHKINSAEYQNADLREVLKTLFKEVNASYSIPPDIQGSITLSMRDAKFELVLQNVLAQVNATYRYEGGVFVIVKREALGGGTPDAGPVDVPKTNGKIVRKIYIRSADPALIALLLSGTGNQSYQGGPEITSLNRMGQMGGMGGMGGGMMGGMGGMGGGMMGGMGGMGGGMMGGMGGMGGGMMGGMGGMGGGMMGGMGGFGGGGFGR